MNRSEFARCRLWNNRRSLCGMGLLALLAACVAIDLARADDGRRSSRRSRARNAAAAEPKQEAEPPREERTDRGEKQGLTLLDVLDYAEQSRAQVKEVKDYTAVFTKTELVNRKLIKQVM